MNWMIKVSIGMLLFATLLIALGLAFIRANEYKPGIQKIETKTTVAATITKDITSTKSTEVPVIKK